MRVGRVLAVTCPTCRSDDLTIKRVAGFERIRVVFSGTRRYHCEACDTGFYAPDRRGFSRETLTTATAAPVKDERKILNIPASSISDDLDVRRRTGTAMGFGFAVVSFGIGTFIKFAEQRLSNRAIRNTEM
jgi:hypothetical protein